MRISKLKVENLYGIEQLELDGKSVELSGSNGMGKSSVLDAIRLALTNNSKRKCIVKNGKIIPADNYCHNCGSSEFTVERLPQINFFDVNFAVVVKKVFCSKNRESYTQSWVDAKQEADIQKLLPQSL